MKRFIIAMALVVFMTGAVSAEGMMFGIKGGLNLASVAGDDSSFEEDEVTLDPSMKLAFGGGIWFNFPITETFSVQPEALLMLKGTKYEETILGADVTLTPKFTYIDINLLGKYTIPTEGNFAPFITAGPQIGLLMSAKVKFEVSGGGMSLDEEEDIKDNSKSIDFGIVLGVGFDYMLESGCITFDARYVLGMTSVDDPETGDAADIKNTGIMFLVGYGFSL